MPKDMNTTDSIFERRESEARSYCRGMPATFTTASGSEITDDAGKTYIDFLAGCSSLNYGHNDPDMKAALVEHISNDGITHGLDMYTDTKAAFLKTFEEKILEPRGLDYKVMMTGPTGTNAVEAAMKLARKVTGRRNIVAFTNGFHGMTMGALSCTGNAGKRAGAGAGPLCGVSRMPFEGAFGEDVDTLAQIEMMLDNPSSGIDAPAAFILEPVQGEGGLNAASTEWMQGIARLAKSTARFLSPMTSRRVAVAPGRSFRSKRWGSNRISCPWPKACREWDFPLPRCWSSRNTTSGNQPSITAPSGATPMLS